jgi:hypothetical protein
MMVSPTGVSVQPPPLWPPCSECVAGDLSERFSSSISSQARRYATRPLRRSHAPLSRLTAHHPSRCRLPRPDRCVRRLRRRRDHPQLTQNGVVTQHKAMAS